MNKQILKAWSVFLIHIIMLVIIFIGGPLRPVAVVIGLAELVWDWIKHKTVFTIKLHKKS